MVCSYRGSAAPGVGDAGPPLVVQGRHVTVCLNHEMLETGERREERGERRGRSYPDQELRDGQVAEGRRQVERSPRVAAAHRAVNILGLAVRKGEADLK